MNLALAIGGIAVSTGGFALTLWQLKKTRSAAEASEVGSTNALHALTSRHTATDIADMRSMLRGIQTALRGNRIETALLQTQNVVEQLTALRSRPEFADEAKRAEIQSIVVQLAKLRDRCEAKLDNPQSTLSRANANALLSTLGEQLTVWHENLRFAAVEKK